MYLHFFHHIQYSVFHDTAIVEAEVTIFLMLWMAPRHQQSTPAVAFLMAGATIQWPAVEVRCWWVNHGEMKPQTVSHFNRGNAW